MTGRTGRAPLILLLARAYFLTKRLGAAVGVLADEFALPPPLQLGNPASRSTSEGWLNCRPGLDDVKTPKSIALEELRTSVGSREPISFEGVEVGIRGSNVRWLCVDDAGCYETVHYKG